MSILTPALKVEPFTVMRRRRELPLAGEIVVAMGDRVKATQIVARAFLPGELVVVRLPEQMGIEPPEVRRGLRVKEGDTICAGETLCEHVGLFGLFRTLYPAPTGGAIEFISEKTGHLGLRSPSRPIELNAYISGEVTAIEVGKAVTVTSAAALVQGVFGVGGEQQGVLRILQEDQARSTDAACLPEQCNGTILITRTAPSIELVKLAANRGVVGLVTGSIHDRVLTEYLGYELGVAITGDENLTMTLILTEGFGEMPISPRALDLFRRFEGRAASINGATQVRAGAVRPEIVICREGEAGSKEDEETISSARGLVVGARVRLIRVPHFGEIAIVVELPTQPEQIATGARTRILRARLGSGEVVNVPRANVELI